MKCPNCNDGNAAPVDAEGSWIRCHQCRGTGIVPDDGSPKPAQCQMREVFGRCEGDCWTHPEKGPLCVCEHHFNMIEAGLMRVPPLRQNIDYISTGRKTFLIEQIADSALPVHEPKPEK